MAIVRFSLGKNQRYGNNTAKQWFSCELKKEMMK